MAYQTRKYQPKRLSERHYAVLRGLFAGMTQREVARHHGLSVSQVGRIVNSVLGRDYLDRLHSKTIEVLAQAKSAMLMADQLTVANRRLGRMQ